MSRRNLILSFVALFVLRFAIGFHFFNEGSSKIRKGDFNAAPFFLAAKGPLADSFHSLVDDHDGEIRFCYREKIDDWDQRVESLDPTVAYVYWRDFLIRADERYQFGSDVTILQAEKAHAKLNDEIREQKQLSAEQRTLDLAKAEYELKVQMDEIKRMQRQRTAANAIIERYENNLANYLLVHEEEILNYFREDDRLTGFDRDGPNREKVANQVESLLGQVTTIESERKKKAAEWLAEIEKMWDGLESEINELASEEQRKSGPVKLVRPYDPPNSKINMINQWVPWFDMAIGALLMLGLFSRLASFLGAGFLATVIATQPPWVMDSIPTFYQSVELAGLLVIFATCAGRYAGLDYFIHQIWIRYIAPDSAEENESESDA